MMQLPISDNDPNKGAAYQVLYNRFLPHTIVTRFEQSVQNAAFAHVLKWAASQPAPVNTAYQWAVKMIGDQIEQRLANTELNLKVNEALKTMPVPPEATVDFVVKEGTIPPLETAVTDPEVLAALK